MGIDSPHVPCSALFLLLLLLPPSVLRVWALQYRGSGWRLFHHLTKGSKSPQSYQVPGGRHHWYSAEQQQSCQGVFDLYFILDKSGSVDNNWIHVYSFVEDMVEKFLNPRLQMSFITYSRDADIILPLTSDRIEIRKGLMRLQKVLPGGHTLMQKGFKKANEQIQMAQRGGKHVASMIIALTDGTLFPDVFKKTVSEANKARNMGAVIYTVGVFEYSKYQMTAVADSPDHIFGVDHGFRGLRDIVNTLSSRSCMEATSVEPPIVCAGEFYKVDIFGRGFQNTKGQDQVICRFKLSDAHIIDEKVISMTENSITCPGPVIEQPKQEVSVAISLSNGAAFLGNQLSITSISCMKAKGNPLSSKMLLVLLPGLLLSLLLLWCCWKFCCKKPAKEPPPPPPPEPEEEPEEEQLPPSQALAPVNTSPTVIVACCGCGDGNRGNLDPCCSYFSPNCHQVPVMLCQPRGQGRCTNLAVMNPSCTQVCNPKICLRPNRECFHITQPPSSSPRIILPPSRECFHITQAPDSSKMYFRTIPECVPVTQTLYTPKICPQPNQRCFSVNSYPQCHHLQNKCVRSPSRMLPLIPPNTRKSVDAPCHSCRPTSKGPKT